MSRILIDTSVVIKWFRTDGESEIAEARALRDAHLSDELDAVILDLGLYEVGNVLVRALKWPADEVAGQLVDLQAIVGPPLTMQTAWLRSAAELAAEHGLSFYDASWAAAARESSIPLVSADRQLISTGLAESPRAIATRLRLIRSE